MTTPWWDDAYCALDFETSGVDVTRDRIVTASWVKVQPGKRPQFFDYLIAVDVEIPAEATAVHGVTTEHARENGQPAALVLEGVAADVAIALNRGQPLIGFNVSFDLSLLENELRRNGIPTLAERLDGRVAPVVDSLVLDKADAPYRKGKRNLTAVCEHRGVLLGGAHEASADALAAARLAAVITRGNEAMAAMSLAELHDAQIGWRREQCESLAAYFAKQGKPQHVCPHWPICSDAACAQEKQVA